MSDRDETRVQAGAARIERLRTQRLPRLLALKSRVAAGGGLDTFEIAFLNDLYTDATAHPAAGSTDPALHAINGEIVALYREITELALDLDPAVERVDADAAR
jgi:hypothetical protein